MTARPIARYAATAAAYAAAGTFGALAAGPALGPALWWAMNHQPTLPSPSVLGVALLVLGVIWVSAQDSGEESEPVRPARAGLLARLAQRWHEARERCERDMAAHTDFVAEATEAAKRAERFGADWHRHGGLRGVL